MRDYELVVFLDGDVQMNHPELPIEWLLNRWDFAPTSLMAMAEDPTSDDNRDKNGKIALNTGFVVVRNDARSFQLLDELIACPDVLPGCEVTAHEWSHEQRAFSMLASIASVKLTKAETFQRQAASSVLP